MFRSIGFRVSRHFLVKLICFPISRLWAYLIKIILETRSYPDFLDRVLLLRRKLLEKGFLLVRLKSSLRKFCCRHHDLIHRYGISVSQMTTNMFRCHKLFPVLSLFMTYHRVCEWINTTGVTSGAGTAYPLHEFTPGLSVLN